MKKISFGIILLLVFTQTQARLTWKKIQKKQTYEKSISILRTLADDDKKGRKPNTEGMDKAVNFIEKTLQDAKINPLFGQSFKDSFDFGGYTTYNLVGLLKSKQKTSEYILIGAHYDHLGLKKSKNDSIYNGANDNATGVTAVLEVARLLQGQNLNKNIIIALFSEEESGLNGSEHLAKRLKNENYDLKYVINFEMLGKILTNKPNQVYISGFDYSNFAEETNKLLEKPFITEFEKENRYGIFSRSDNYPFYTVFKIPSHTWCTFDFKNFDYYHDVDDEIENLDLENFHSLIQLSTWSIYQLLTHDIKLKMN